MLPSAVRVRSLGPAIAVRHATYHRVGRVAQLGERCVRNAEAESSILSASTNLRSRSHAEVVAL